MKTNKFWSDFWPEICTSLLILMVFLISVDVYQYLTTEVWWLWDETSYNQNTWFLLALIVGGAFLPMKSWLTKWPKLGYLLVGLFLITIVAHQKYSRFYDQLQQYPKIKSLSKEWGVAWSYVKVTGKNFGGEWNPGQVYLSETPMIVRKWTPKEIIFEIPAETEVGEHNLKVVSANNLEQNRQQNFEVREHVN